MRVEGGSARGIELKAPPGRSVRPTMSLVRQAIFSMIGSSGSPCGTVLDLFAGSGALGIEALSRGASWADFVDKSRECCTMIRQNLERTGFSDRAAVHCLAASQAPEALQRQYDVVFVDPPYDDPSTDSIVATLAGGRLLSRDALVVVSHGNRHPLSDSHGTLVTFKSRRYGDTYVAMYRREEQ